MDLKKMLLNDRKCMKELCITGSLDMRNPQKSIATVCGIGYTGKREGTVASVVYCTIFLY
jgi:hypothetical protein